MASDEKEKVNMNGSQGRVMQWIGLVIVWGTLFWIGKYLLGIPAVDVYKLCVAGLLITGGAALISVGEK
jgi:hypothetical protein